MSIGSDTPRTDEIVAIASIEDRYVPLRNLARTLERDLARVTAANEALRKALEDLLSRNSDWWREKSHCKGEAQEFGMPDDADAPLVTMGDLRKLLATLAEALNSSDAMSDINMRRDMDMGIDSDTQNYDEVICPHCVHQFRAIPLNVQSDLARLTEEKEASANLTNNGGLSMFHWRNNIYFGRLDDGTVRVVQFSERPHVMRWHNKGATVPTEHPRADGEFRSVQVLLDVRIPPYEWASIVAAVSKDGESNGGHQAALSLHGLP